MSMSNNAELMEVGNTSSGGIWIGFPDSHYEKIEKPLSKRTVHAFSMTVDVAYDLVEMIRDEIDRAEHCSRSEMCKCHVHFSDCPVGWEDEETT